MTRQRKTITILLYLSGQLPILFTGLLAGSEVRAIDYQNEYEEEPAPTSIMAIVCVLCLVAKHPSNAEPVNITLKEY